MTAADRIAQDFVAFVHSHPRERTGIEFIPAGLAVGEPDEWGAVDWRIASWSANTAVDALEEALQMRFPKPYRALVSSYSFPCFVWRNLILFANAPVFIEAKGFDLRAFPRHDRALFDPLQAARLLPFARLDGGQYDPICFDAAHWSRNGDCPVVRVDHESVLQRGVPRITRILFASSRELLLPPHSNS